MPAVDAEDVGRSSVAVSVPVTSGNTPVPALNQTFTTMYFDASVYPTITLAGTGVHRMSDSTPCSGPLIIVVDYEIDKNHRIPLFDRLP